MGFSPFFFGASKIMLNKRADKLELLRIAEAVALEKAIDKAGGFNEFADRKRVYVIKANGLIEKTGRNVFVRSSNLMPGDTIVVPRKTSTNALKNLTPITQILSDLAFSAAAIDNLSNN